jgi:hypothetical protein
VAQEEEPGRESFLEGRLARFEAIPALVEPRTRRVEDQDRRVLEEGDLDREKRPVLGKALELVRRFQPLDDRFLHDALARGDARKRRANGSPAHRDPRVSREKLLPGDGAGALEERVEVGGGKRGELEEDPIGGAQPQVRAGEGGLVRFEGEPARSERAARVAERFELTGDDGFEAEGGGRDERQIHGAPPSSILWPRYAMRSVRFRSSSTFPILPAPRSCLRPSTSSSRRSGTWAKSE